MLGIDTAIIIIEDENLHPLFGISAADRLNNLVQKQIGRRTCSRQSQVVGNTICESPEEFIPFG